MPAKFGPKLSVPLESGITEEPLYLRTEYFSLLSYCFPNEHDRLVCFFQLLNEVPVTLTSLRSLQAYTANSPCDLVVACCGQLQVLIVLCWGLQLQHIRIHLLLPYDTT